MGDSTAKGSQKTQSLSGDYHKNQNYPVTRKMTDGQSAQTSCYTFNEDGSVTKNTIQQKQTVSRSFRQSQKSNTDEQEKTQHLPRLILCVGTIIWIIASIIFFICLILNASEDIETIADWIALLIGFPLFSGFIYFVIFLPILVLIYDKIIRPVLNWVDNLV